MYKERETVMAIVTITDENYVDEVENSDIPVLLDFWAEWCMPCRMLSPTVEEIAEEHEGEIKVGKVNVDEQAELSRRFGIMSIPTLAVIKNGETVQRAVGLRDKQDILDMLF